MPDDNGYRAAQRAYDAQLPPEPEEYFIECEECDEGLDDNGDTCKKCAGEGELVVTKAAFEAYMKRKGLTWDYPCAND